MVKKTILVVDDDDLGLRLVRDVATMAGYAVLTATNGKQGLAVAQERRPDLILLDVMMPEMDGYTAARRLRDNPATARTPVIMLTAMGYALDKKTALELGAVDYITKPYDIHELVAKVQQYIGPPGEAPPACADNKHWTRGAPTPAAPPP